MVATMATRMQIRARCSPGMNMPGSPSGNSGALMPLSPSPRFLSIVRSSAALSAANARVCAHAQQHKYEKKKQIQVPNAATEKRETENQQRPEGQST